MGNVTVEPLRINEFDLNTKRMLDLMVAREGAIPLYLHVIQRILRDLRIKQQKLGTRFSYTEFKQMVDAATLTKDQLVSLGQRLDTLESFMAKRNNLEAMRTSGKSRPKPASGTDWTPKVRFPAMSHAVIYTD